VENARLHKVELIEATLPLEKEIQLRATSPIVYTTNYCTIAEDESKLITTNMNTNICYIKLLDPNGNDLICKNDSCKECAFPAYFVMQGKKKSIGLQRAIENKNGIQTSPHGRFLFKFALTCPPAHFGIHYFLLQLTVNSNERIMKGNIIINFRSKSTVISNKVNIIIYIFSLVKEEENRRKFVQ
jgi:hypothetical protein